MIIQYNPLVFYLSCDKKSRDQYTLCIIVLLTIHHLLNIINTKAKFINFLILKKCNKILNQL